MVETLNDGAPLTEVQSSSQSGSSSLLSSNGDSPMANTTGDINLATGANPAPRTPHPTPRTPYPTPRICNEPDFLPS
jgi:hypothetical protein